MIDSLVAALDGLAAADPCALADSESVVALHQQLTRLEAVTARVAARWDAGQGWAADGAKSGAAWLAWRCRLPKRVAQGLLRLGRALRHLPVTEAAWLDGDINSSHVALLAAARNEHTEDAMARDEETLVEDAKRQRFSGFVKRLAYWRQEADPDADERRAERQVEDRRVDLSQTFQGMWLGDMVFDPIRGTIVSDALTRIERELFDADWAEAKERLGREPVVTDLARTPKQRRADAMVEMAIRAMSTPNGGRRPEPLFTVLVGYETFAGRVCELANGTVITPRSVRPWLDQAWVERVVFNGRSRVIDVGVTQRLFTGATRRAVEVRDHDDGCFNETCDDPIEQIDHIKPWADEGPTVQANGRGACGFHNRNRRPGDG